MNLRQIELLRAVVRCETTVRAAQELGLSQPAVSNAIKHLESQIGFPLTIEPVKGQMVLLRATPLPFQCVIQVGREYLVPRQDGRILIGSTEERTGFDKRNTSAAIGDLIDFGQRVVPSLRCATFETCWAGLRPYSTAGKPYIGRIPHVPNALVAAGHYRYGLHMSPITAVLIRQILLQQSVLLPEECVVRI